MYIARFGEAGSLSGASLPQPFQKLIPLLPVDGRQFPVQYFGFGPSEDLFGGLVPCQNAPLQVHDEDCERRSSDDRLKPVVGLAQALLGFLALCDVAGIHHHAGHAGIVHQAARHGVENAPSAIFMPNPVFRRGGGNSRLHEAETLGQVSCIVRMDQPQRVLARQFLRPITEDPFRGRAGVHEVQIGVNNADDVQRILEQRSKALLAALQLEQHPLALLGIAHRSHQKVAIHLAFHKIILSALANGGDGEFGVVPSGQHYHRQIRSRILDPLQTIQAAGVGQREIEKSHVKAMGRELSNRLTKSAHARQLNVKRADIVQRFL